MQEEAPIQPGLGPGTLPETPQPKRFNYKILFFSLIGIVLIVGLVLLIVNLNSGGGNGGSGSGGSSGGGVSVAPQGSLKIVAPQNGVYFGAYNYEENGVQGILEFEEAVGKKVAIISGQVCESGVGGGEGSAVATELDVKCYNDLYEQGYISTVEFLGFFGGGGYFTTQEVIDGKADEIIKITAKGVKELGKPIFSLYPREPGLQWRVGYGGDSTKTIEEVTDKYGNYGCKDTNDEMCLDGPERFRDMQKHAHDVVESECKDCVTWVAAANIPQGASGNYELYYPGNDYVDWHAFDVYPDALESGDLTLFSETVEESWNEAQGLANKPVMIVEFGVYNSFNPSITDEAMLGGYCNPNDPNRITLDRVSWFEDFFKQVKREYNELGAFIYWQMGDESFDCTDSRIRKGDSVSSTWKTEIKNNPGFWISNIETEGGTVVTGPGGGVAVSPGASSEGEGAGTGDDDGGSSGGTTGGGDDDGGTGGGEDDGGGTTGGGTDLDG